MKLISFEEEENLNANEGLEQDINTNNKPTRNETASLSNENKKAEALINRVGEDKALDVAKKLLSRGSIDNRVFTEVQKLLNK